MSASKTLKEKIVIFFFALTLVTLTALAIINPRMSREEHEHESADNSVPLQERIKKAEEVVKTAPENVPALIRLGDLYMDSNQQREAMNTFNDVLKIEPDNTHALSDLGIIYQQAGFYEQAFDLYKKVEKLDPNNLSALYYLGMLNRYYKEDKEEALKYFNKVLSRAGSDKQVIQMITKEIESIKAEGK